MFLFLTELISWKYEPAVRFPKWFCEMTYICTVLSVYTLRLAIPDSKYHPMLLLLHEPLLVSHDTNSIALLLWICWFCLLIILGGRTWKHWASASITEIMCNSSELTLLLNKPTVGVMFLFPPSSIPDFRFSAVLTDIGDCIIAFSVKMKLWLCNEIMIYYREFSEGVAAFCLSMTISSKYKFFKFCSCHLHFSLCLFCMWMHQFIAHIKTLITS